jgi:hypothetical protein
VIKGGTTEAAALRATRKEALGRMSKSTPAYCRPQAERDPSLHLGEYKKVDNCTRKSDGTVHRYARAAFRLHDNCWT